VRLIQCYRVHLETFVFTELVAAPWLKRLVAGFPPRRPGFAPGSDKWNLWWTKWRRSRFSPSISVSPAKTVHSTNFSILTITRGRYNRPEWPQCRMDPVWTPPFNIQIKRYTELVRKFSAPFFFFFLKSCSLSQCS
jgi:hypothetical protein